MAASPPSAAPWQFENHAGGAKGTSPPSAAPWQVEHHAPGFADEIKPKECEGQVRRQRLLLEVGLVSMEQDSDLNVRFLNCLVTLWNALSRDERRHRTVAPGNATRNDLVAAILTMVSVDPTSFFHVMNKELATAQEWLWDLSDRGTIVLEGNQTCPFEYQRRNLLEIVGGTVVPPEEDALRQRVLARLNEVRCRMFN